MPELDVSCSASLISCVQVKDGKKAKFKLGVSDPKLGSAIQETTGVPCVANDMVGVDAMTVLALATISATFFFVNFVVLRSRASASKQRQCHMQQQ